jgi:ergothioneine biosynthesis protein EgtB
MRLDRAPSLSAAPALVPGLSLQTRYSQVRAASEAISAALSDEDCQLQSMPDASPIKWHLAHTSWFFETFVLVPNLPGYACFDPAFAVLFNSYYVGVGDRHPRPERGMLSRPSRSEIIAYRHHVDAATAQLIAADASACRELIELGLHHEQQHQELMRMDILHAFSRNPTAPACDPAWQAPPRVAPDRRWHTVAAGLYRIGHDNPEQAGEGFAFDNETPAHRIWLEDYRIADRLVNAGAYQDFIADGGYSRPELWLSDGWATAISEGWNAPLYWQRGDGAWTIFSPAGPRPIDPDEAVMHVSYYEADAFARWAGARLPTEAEWEVAAPRFAQGFGVGWQWTHSAYNAYPGFRPATGAVGEYNGKFMINQLVLRGSSWATPPGHARATYRNFFPPAARWMMSAIRLADQA